MNKKVKTIKYDEIKWRGEIGHQVPFEPFSDTPFTGYIIRDRYEYKRNETDTRPQVFFKTKKQYKDGVLDGISEEYYDDDNVYRRYLYKNNRPTIMEEYEYSGVLFIRITYEGLFGEDYYEAKRIRSLNKYTNGFVEEYYKSGELYMTKDQTWLDPQSNLCGGTERYWFRNGKRKLGHDLNYSKRDQEEDILRSRINFLKNECYHKRISSYEQNMAILKLEDNSESFEDIMLSLGYREGNSLGWSENFVKD